MSMSNTLMSPKRWRVIICAAVAVYFLMITCVDDQLFKIQIEKRRVTEAQQNLPAELTNTPFIANSLESSYVELTGIMADYFRFIDVPTTNVAEMGWRLRLFRSMIARAAQSTPDMQAGIWMSLDTMGQAMFPFVQHPEAPSYPFHAMVHSHQPGTSGIVITAGQNEFHFACHLIANIRDILGSELPIQIAYAGEEDLPVEYREFMSSIFSDITFLNVYTRISDKTLELAKGRYAIKPFAALLSPFERTLLLDADLTFLQDPATIFSSAEFDKTGTTLYHDRAVWFGTDRFHDDWWQKQFHDIDLHPNSQIFLSRAYQERFSENGESGVIAFDKGRLDVHMALWHVAWQNTLAVREESTYKLANGDKESWWLAFEALRVPYSMEQRYASALGQACDDPTTLDDPHRQRRVCTHYIAHGDFNDNLLWWNGGLLKNKHVNASGYEIPNVWMRHGEWDAGNNGKESVMVGERLDEVSDGEKEIVRMCFEAAKLIDKAVNEAFPGLEDRRFAEPQGSTAVVDDRESQVTEPKEAVASNVTHSG